MILALQLLSLALATLVGVPCLVLFVEIVTGLRDGSEHIPPSDARIAVIMPAHNEALVIERTLRALLAVARAGSRILVVADNCTDDTAAIARNCEVEVIERHDLEQRGKGYALACARDRIAQDETCAPPDVVVVLDADCRISPGSLERLAGACIAAGRPAQARNLLDPPPGSSPMVQISCFAFVVKNLLRARGLYRLCGSITLMGTGMAFPWAIISELPLATGHLAEDMALGVDLVRSGKGAILVSSARVTSPPAAQADTLEQRMRWEHGFLSVAVKQAIPLVAEGLRRAKPELLALGLHLTVPPLAMMAAMIVLTISALAVGVLLGGPVLPLWIFAVVALAAASAVLAGWFRHGRNVLRPAVLLRVPLYVAWKLPVYLRFLTRRETRWIRTKR